MFLTVCCTILNDSAYSWCSYAVPVAFSPFIDINIPMFLSAVPDIRMLTIIAPESSDPWNVVGENCTISPVKHTCLTY